MSSNKNQTDFDMTNLTADQISYIKERQQDILKLHDEIKQKLSVLKEHISDLWYNKGQLEDVLGDFYERLYEEQMVPTGDAKNADQFVEGQMQNWYALPWLSVVQIFKLEDELSWQITNRLDTITNEVNQVDKDMDSEEDCPNQLFGRR